MARYEIGELAVRDASFTDDDDQPVDPPSITATVRAPNGNETVYTWSTGDPGTDIVHDALGQFHLNLHPDAPGRWQDFWQTGADGPVSETGTFDVAPKFNPNWRPVVADVGALIRTRTKTRLNETFAGGNEIGTFVDDGRTRPTGEQVERLIDQAVDDVTDTVGTNVCTPELQSSAGRVAAIGAAMLVELSYFSEQISNDNQSPYTALERLYKDRLNRLSAGVAEKCGTGADGGTGLLPTHTMPPGGCDWERF